MNEETKKMVLKESDSEDTCQKEYEGLVETSMATSRINLHTLESNSKSRQSNFDIAQSSQSKPIAPLKSGKSHVNTVEFRDVYEPELAAPSVTIKKNDEPIMPLAIKRENNSLMEELVVDYNISPNLKVYCEILEILQNHHVEEDSQSARRFIKMLKWFCVDYELFLTTGWEERLQQSSFPTPQISLRLVSAVFLKHTNDKLHSVVPILKNLITKGKIFDSDVNYLSFETIRRLFDKSKKKCNEIGTLTVASFVPVWEFHHFFPGHDKCGSSRSDFIGIVFNQTNIRFPFFLIKFEQNGFEVHKDEIVTFSLNIMTSNLETDVESVLKLVSYLREVVCRDGAWIENMINRQQTKFSINLKAALPSLPTKAVKFRPFETKYTSISKRVKYDFLDKDDE
ncbi:ran-binding protein 10 [Gigaspora margarita]|uniref:Ran-binding protein 10 n=1 Tax=Gigaspora margarita TaxID=4874 RepID=A0A8H4ARY7_GIGMA|nr:ran-binding protein 10 [Gigaspora margarita]